MFFLNQMFFKSYADLEAGNEIDISNTGDGATSLYEKKIPYVMVII